MYTYRRNMLSKPISIGNKNIIQITFGGKIQSSNISAFGKRGGGGGGDTAWRRGEMISVKHMMFVLVNGKTCSD